MPARDSVAIVAMRASVLLSNEVKAFYPARLVQARSMSSDQRIAEIKRQLGEAVSRIESVQSGQNKPLLSKIANHLRTQSGSLVNVMLAASVFAVALGKLNQKTQHQASVLPCMT